MKDLSMEGPGEKCLRFAFFGRSMYFCIIQRETNVKHLTLKVGWSESLNLHEFSLLTHSRWLQTKFNLTPFILKKLKLQGLWPYLTNSMTNPGHKITT